ncbi:MAG TPA: hypothetical protein VJY66_02785, partial [Acholeplasma sp.]|nr:hypothetical protein [Acholeplasma sp.]
MLNFPKELVFTVSEYIDIVVNWILDKFSFLFDFIRTVIEETFDLTEVALSFIPWWGYIILVFIAGYKLYSIRSAIGLSLMLFAIGMFGLWDMMIYTLVIVLLSVFVSLIIGIPTGILMAKSGRAERILKPILDGMQTMPSFVYLIP